MTSSPADEEIEESPKKVPGWRQPWDTWRIVMMAGSLVLLGLAFSRMGGRTRLPEWGMAAVYAVGYGLLAYGFFLAMRTRKDLKAKREAEEKEKKVSPRDPG
jgi:hypothetical protein